MKNLGTHFFGRIVLFFAILSVFGAGLIFVAPKSVSAKEGLKARDIIEENRAKAMAEEAGSGAEVEDYNFVVIEEDEVPLAMAPEAGSGRKASVIWVVVCALLLVGSVVYIIAFVRYRERIKVIENNISREKKKSLKDGCLMFHPMKRAELAEEIENELVSRYFE